MKKNGIRSVKIIIFVIGFCFLFLELQKVFHYHWDDLYSANILLKTQPEDAYDVLYFGTSELKASVFPTAIFHYTGVTGFNCSVTNKSAMTMYYQLEYALRYQNPKIVCCDFSALYDDVDFSNRETIFRKAVDTMPDYDLKWEMIKSIKEMDSTQSELSYVFPFLRYHSIWNELTEKNFQEDYVYDEKYPVYKNGSALVVREDKGEYYDLTPEIWEAEPSNDPIPPTNVEWYDKFIELCHDQGIIVVALFPPVLGNTESKVARWETTKEYLDARGVDIIDLNTYETVRDMGILVDEDYLSDNLHMTYTGNLRASRYLAYILVERYGLPDHRSEELAKQWNEQWNEFCENYDVPEEFQLK